MATPTSQPIMIALQDAQLEGDISLPSGAHGLVIFAHGSGSSRLSPRNIYVAHYLNRLYLGTLLFDLLTEEEDKDPQARFDIALLAKRLTDVTRWVKQEQFGKHPLGFFGASTGSAAALIAASDLPGEIGAVVSRGGRPDLAFEGLARVQAATLLIVGGNDFGVIDLNKQAYKFLTCEKKLAIVPGATHLFEEPGALEQVAKFAGDWFLKYLGTSSMQE